MLDLRRLRLLRELSERGTIAAVAEALQYTPSAISQQLALLEREAGVALLERAGRGVRLTDPAVVLVEHAEALLQRAALAEADLAAAAGTVSGRVRIAGFQSVSLQIALPAIERLRESAPRLRCELVEGEPENSLPALALGDVDVVLGDEWFGSWHLPTTLTRERLLVDPVGVLVPASLAGEVVALEALAGEHWVTGPAGMAWDEMTQRTCRERGGFEPDVRFRTNDPTVGLALVARGLAVTLLPDLAISDRPAGVVRRALAGPPLTRDIHVVTRVSDAARPSVQAVLAAVREVVA